MYVGKYILEFVEVVYDKNNENFLFYIKFKGILVCLIFILYIKYYFVWLIFIMFSCNNIG